MQAVFRADASVELGSGHVMRCLTLAGSLAELGWDCGFAARPGSPEAAPALGSAGYAIHLLEDDPGAEASALRRRWPDGVDWLVVDHYGRDGAFESACRPWAKHILALDDLADRPHDCDLLLDQTLNRVPADYAGLVPDGCRLQLGARFALLRPEFAALRNRSLAAQRGKASPLRLLVSLGGTDPQNVTAAVLDAIARSGVAAAVDVVMGGGSPGLAEIRARVAATPGHKLHVSPANLGELMAGADLAIGAAGTSSWERCCLGLPTILLVLAANQRDNAEQLFAAGAVRVVAPDDGDIADSIARALKELAGDPGALEAMSGRAAALCDGQGALRARLALLPAQPSRDGSGVTLRLAEAYDEAVLLHWQQQPAIRSLARNPRIPTAEEHHRWFAARMRSPDSFITLIEHGGRIGGMLRLDRVKGAGSEAGFEVSIVVDEAHRGAGVALAALRQIRAWMPQVDFHAETLPNNAASISLFRSAGYRQLGEHLLHSPTAQ